MYKAKAGDKPQVLRILKAALEKDPHTNWYVTGNTESPKDPEKYEAFLEYNFQHAMLQGTVYLSDDNNGCAMWVEYGNCQKSRAMFNEDIKFLGRFGLFHTLSVLRLQKKIAETQPYRRFLHLLYLGVHPDHQKKGIAGSLLKPVLNNASDLKLPVLLETSTEVNVKIYSKIGFEVYHTLELGGPKKLQIYFMEKS